MRATSGERRRFVFAIEAVGSDIDYALVGWTNTGIPEEIVIAMTQAFLRKTTRDCQHGFEVLTGGE